MSYPQITGERPIGCFLTNANDLIHSDGTYTTITDDNNQRIIKGRFYPNSSGAPVWGAIDDVQENWPAFMVREDTAIPNIQARVLMLSDANNPPQLEMRLSRTEEPVNPSGAPLPQEPGSIGNLAAHMWSQVYSAWTTASGGRTGGFDAAYNLAKPIQLAGSSPSFTGILEVSTGAPVTSLTTGEYYLLRLPAASGTNPTINLTVSGTASGAKALKRDNGSTPASNYWSAGAQIKALYDGSVFKADVASGSDAGGMGASNIGGQIWNNLDVQGRLYQVQILQPSIRNEINSEGTWNLRVTPKNTLSPISRMWAAGVGSVVVAGVESHEMRTDSNGHLKLYSYPGELDGETVYEAVDPRRTGGWGNISVALSDQAVNTGWGSLSLRRPDAQTKGLDLGMDYTNDDALFIACKPGTGTNVKTITNARNDGGNIQLYIANHGLPFFGYGELSAFDSGLNRGYTFRRIDKDWIELYASRSNGLNPPSLPSSGTFTVGDRTPVGGVRTGTGVAWWGGASYAKAVARFVPVANGENSLEIVGAASGNGPSIRVAGADTNALLSLESKGSSPVLLRPGGATSLRLNAQGGGQNYMTFDSVGSGNHPRLMTEGSDANINLRLAAQGGGAVVMETAMRLHSRTKTQLDALTPNDGDSYFYKPASGGGYPVYGRSGDGMGVWRRYSDDTTI